MPRPKKAGWERVTLTLSPEVVLALRQICAVSHLDLGVEADRAMRRGQLFERLNYVNGKGEPVG